MSYYPHPFGRYWLLKPLAEGGMGALHVAAVGDPGLEKLCVIKTVLQDHNDDAYSARFLGEAQVMVRLSHGNLVSVLDVGRVDNQLYVAMDYVQGKDLRAVWNRCAQKRIAFPVEVAVHIVREVVRGLHYAHTAPGIRLVHRDVSPQNILLSFAGEVKLADFGLAKSTLSTVHTEHGVVYGKVSYMSPEQARGDELDPRSDLYSAAIILWELLTGRQLFPESSLPGRKRDDQVPRASSVTARVPADLDDLLHKALSPTREGRYPDGEAMRAALASWLGKSAPETDATRVSRFLSDLYEGEVLREQADNRALLLSLRSRNVRTPGSEVTPVSSLLPGVLVDGRYQLRRIIGEGGMGQVWAAEHTQIGKPVAVKFLRSVHARGPSVLEAFRREARATSKIQHKNVATVTDAGSYGDTLFLVMELLEGRTLQEELRQKGRLPLSLVLHIGYQIADTLAAAHASGVVHRDLKPANIFLLPGAPAPGTAGPDGGSGLDDEPEPGVKVLDFGVALTLAEEEKRGHLGSAQVAGRAVTGIAGTLDYMAPEQLAGKPCDGRADIYALGTMLYQMLSGELPMTGPTAELVRDGKLSREAPDLSLVAPDVPPLLVQVVMRALRRDPRERFPGMREMADALLDIREELMPSVPGLPEGQFPDEPEPGPLPPLGWRLPVPPGIFAAMAAGIAILVFVTVEGLGSFPVWERWQRWMGHPPPVVSQADLGTLTAPGPAALAGPPTSVDAGLPAAPPDLLSPPDLRPHVRPALVVRHPGPRGAFLGKRAVLVPKIKQIGREEAQQQLANGHAALSKGQIQAALAACGDALKNDKVRCRAQTCLAEIAFTEGDFHKAVQEGERAVRCPGADRDAHLMLGDAYLRDGKADKAREQYQTVLRIDPENRAALAGIERTRPTAKAPF